MAYEPIFVFKPDVVFYHADCRDGFGAAWSVWREHPNATFIPIAYHDTLDANTLDLLQQNVLFVDYCPTEKQLHEVHLFAKQVLIVDHHKSAYDKILKENPGFVADGSHQELTLHSCSPVYVRMDLDHSGAYLAYVNYNLSKALPELIQYIEDRDLWRWELPNSREVSAYLGALPFEFEAYEAAYHGLSSGTGSDRVIAAGKLILAAQKRVVDKLADEAYFVSLIPMGIVVQLFCGMACNVPQATALQSEVGEELLRRHPEIVFAACYSDTADGHRRWSFRSRDAKQFDCQAWAVRYPGGGGHPCAAGYAVPQGPAQP